VSEPICIIKHYISEKTKTCKQLYIFLNNGKFKNLQKIVRELKLDVAVGYVATVINIFKNNGKFLNLKTKK
jgi:hypothetical protein